MFYSETGCYFTRETGFFVNMFISAHVQLLQEKVWISKPKL